MIVNGLKRIRTEVASAELKVLSRYFSGKAKENQKTPQ
jgi:hypothetical protein